MNALTVADLNIVAGDEPRMMDLRLAEALGFAHPRRIRALIRRHLAALKRFGEVRTTAVQTTSAGGRPSKASWLNRKQALFVCTKSETERATEISIEVIEVYDAYLAGQAGPQKVEVRAHRRATPRRSAPSPTQPGRGCMTVEGEGVVWFDRRYLPRPGDTVLVINHCGQPMVATVADRPEAKFTPSYAWIERYPRPMRTWEHVPLIGIVMTPAGRLMRGEPARVPTPG